MTSNTVRLGHQLQSSKRFGDYVEKLKECVDEDFDYIWCPYELPLECQINMKENRKVLVRTRPLLDLTPAEEDQCIVMLNGLWKIVGEVIHWCSPACPNKCKRRVSFGKQKVQVVVLRTLANYLPDALEYRWKHHEKADSWIYRGRRMHDLLGCAMKKV